MGGTALNVSAWSTTAASNDGADSTIGTVANTSAPNVVDDWVRGVMASVKKYILDTDGGLTSGGTANALTLTTNRSIVTGHQAAGFSVRFKAGNTNTGAATVAVDGLTAVSIKRMNGDALVAGDIIAGGIYDIAFDGTNYILMGANPATGSYGALGSDNTWTGANTFSGTVSMTGNVTAGNAAGDVVVIKGTTVNANVSALFDATSVGAFGSEIMDGLGGSSGTPTVFVTGGAGGSGVYNWMTTANAADRLLDALGTETAGALVYHNGTTWVVLAPVTPTSGNYKYLSLNDVGTVAWRDYA